jgi:hypothetical protein
MIIYIHALTHTLEKMKRTHPPGQSALAPASPLTSSRSLTARPHYHACSSPSSVRMLPDSRRRLLPPSLSSLPFLSPLPRAAAGPTRSRRSTSRAMATPRPADPARTPRQRPARSPAPDARPSHTRADATTEQPSPALGAERPAPAAADHAMGQEAEPPDAPTPRRNRLCAVPSSSRVKKIYCCRFLPLYYS